MDSEKYPEYFGLLVSRLYFFTGESAPCPSRNSLRASLPFPWLSFWPIDYDGRGVLSSALSFEVGLDLVDSDEVPVCVGRVNCIRSQHFRFGLEKGLGQPYGRFQSCFLIEGIKAQVLDKADAVHLKFGDLCAELDRFDLFAPYNQSNVRSVKIDDTPLRFYPLVEPTPLLLYILEIKRPNIL